MSRMTMQEAERLVTHKDTTTLSAPDGDALVALARETRRSAERFAATVRRFGSEMPDSLDRFHDAMRAFRGRAAELRTGTA